MPRWCQETGKAGSRIRNLWMNGPAFVPVEE